MASIEQDILTWAEGRPTWQRNLLKRVSRGEPIDAAYVTAIARLIVTDAVVLETPELAAADLPTGTAGGSTIHLVSIGELENINALLGGQTLAFGATGLTVVYGDNGSGKSGYARLAKDVLGARIRSKILPDAYALSKGTQTAEITYSIDGIEQSATWPNLNEPTLTQAHFYDEECGDDYLNNETELAYRPSVLTILDQLITHIDAVRDAVDVLIASNNARALKAPPIPDGTVAEAFVGGLSASTSKGEIDAFLTVPVDADEQFAEVVKEVNRLKATDPADERKRLFTAASSVEVLADHLDEVDRMLSGARGDELLKLQADNSSLGEAATQASQSSFAGEPLSGVGSDTWKVMWEAAERYSQAEAYPDLEFPAADDGQVCVLCQQTLQPDAQDRLARFHHFVHNDIATRARSAREAFKRALEELNDFTVATADTEAAMTFLTGEDKGFGAKLGSALETAAKAKSRIGERLRGDNADAWIALIAVDSAGLRARAASLRTGAIAIDDAAFRQTLADTVSKRDELDGKIALAKSKADIETEVMRLKLGARLQEVIGKISTQAVTKESSDLSRKYVTDAVKNHFIRESERLKLEHVVLGDKGASKGKLRHKPALEGAAKSSPPPPREVLSEGEQTAAGLAGFFTEIEFDETKSAVVLDDPMSSLDHDRRDKAARRIVELGQDRQVIVFTHDLVFLGEIVKVADELGVTLTERAIERNGARRPGLIAEGYPWKARDAKKRIDGLEVELVRLNKEQESLSNEEYEKRSSDLAGKVSETWERIIRTDIVNRVVDRGTTEVKPKMFRLLAKITDPDDTDFQAGYGAVTKWARRHDKSEEVNYTSPTIEELKAEIDRLKTWRERVSKYA
jgi:hypothetical protein